MHMAGFLCGPVSTQKFVRLCLFSSAGCCRDFCTPHPKNVTDANKRDSNPLPLRFLSVSHSHHYVQGTDPVLISRNLNNAAFRQTRPARLDAYAAAYTLFSMHSRHKSVNKRLATATIAFWACPVRARTRRYNASAPTSRPLCSQAHSTSRDRKRC